MVKFGLAGKVKLRLLSAVLALAFGVLLRAGPVMGQD